MCGDVATVKSLGDASEIVEFFRDTVGDPLTIIRLVVSAAEVTDIGQWLSWMLGNRQDFHGCRTQGLKKWLRCDCCLSNESGGPSNALKHGVSTFIAK